VSGPPTGGAAAALGTASRALALPGATPVLEPRDSDAFVRETQARLAAFVPGLQPAPTGEGAALTQVYARYLKALADRINQAPDKNKLRFFELLGVELLPPQAARAPVVFTALASVGDSRVPAATRVGATVAGRDDPLVFETEQAIALAAGHLAQVVSLWPGKDAYADHSAALLRGTPFTLFDALVPVRHELYLAHDVHVALSGTSTVEVRLEIATPATTPLTLAWEYWDGDTWRAFKTFVPAGAAADADSVDGTNGLTRSGTIRLVSDCATTAPTAIDAITARWIRARTTIPLVPAASEVMAQVDRITLRTVVDRQLPVASCAALAESAGIIADAAYAGETKLDLTKAVQPLGTRPQLGSTFLISCEEIFAKPGAEVTLCFRKVLTPEEKADQQGADFELDVVAAQKLVLDAARADANALLRALRAVRAVRAPALVLIPTDAQLDTARDTVIAARDALTAQGIAGIQPLAQAAQELIVLLNMVVAGVDYPGSTLWDFLLGSLGGLIDSDIFGSFDAFRTLNDARIKDSAAREKESAQFDGAALNALEQLTPMSAAMAAGATLPTMTDPVVAWEYWNGRRWATLAVAGAATARTFRSNGPVTFTVPDDIEPSVINGVTGRWIRARVTSGGYGLVRVVSWKDAASGKMNFYPIVEYRPPTIEVVRLGYLWRSAPAFPEHALTYNDFRFTDVSANAQGLGDVFEPFSPVDDRTPALYLGFDRTLPADLVSLYLDIEEVVGETSGPALTWEYYDGSAWRALRVTDDTGDLALPGMAAALWPGVPELPSAIVLQAAASTVRVQDARQGARFAAGDELYLSTPDGAGELVTVQSIDGDTLTLAAPLLKSYTRAAIGIAPLPRFGDPRTWIRARLTSDGEPRRSVVDGIYLNATWAAQLQTIENETLGSSSGQPDQVFFARSIPVLEGETLEVRELVGERAHVEEPVLRAELARAGVPDEDIRIVTDPRTGHTTELWVRWRPRPNLLFSAPGAREYAVERTRGRILFGGGAHGLVPPGGTDNIRLRRYRSGGGVIGNVGARAITQLLAGVLVEGVFNPRAAEGGADGEPLTRVLRRAPHTIRHRRQAITLADYEDLALEASPAVAVARALPTTQPSGRFAPGWVTVRIIPQSSDARPMPSFELRQRVREFLAERAPAAIASRITVMPPEYLAVGVDAVVSPIDPAAAGTVRDAVTGALSRFLHPLTGGPWGDGWPFGRAVYLSDVAALLEAVPGLDFVESLALLVDGVHMGERVSVPAERLVVAGPLGITFSGGEG
jgi:baseplate J-like protein